MASASGDILGWRAARCGHSSSIFLVIGPTRCTGADLYRISENEFRRTALAAPWPRIPSGMAGLLSAAGVYGCGHDRTPAGGRGPTTHPFVAGVDQRVHAHPRHTEAGSTARVSGDHVLPGASLPLYRGVAT